MIWTAQDGTHLLTLTASNTIVSHGYKLTPDQAAQLQTALGEALGLVRAANPPETAPLPRPFPAPAATPTHP